jgi:hypothetical protein
MNAFAFVNYARFLEQDGTPTIYAYQNFSINQQRVYQSVTYEFAPFGYSLGAGSKGGDRSDSSLVAGLDQLTVNLFAEAVQSRWLLEIKTVSLIPVNFADDVLVRTELWRIAQYEMDTERIVLKLSSPLDATKANVPRRRLTTGLVGALPTTGSLVIS